MSLKFFILVGLISNFALARLTDGQVSFKIEKNELTLVPKKGFHLNVEAPANLIFDSQEATQKPGIKTESLFSFSILENTKIARLNYYVCDDKKTACEQHQEKIELIKLKTLGELTLKEERSVIKNNQTEKALTIKNQTKEEGLESTDGKSTLLVFSAPWCPACIRMQTETYHVANVEKIISQMHFKKVNSDLPENSELSEKFNIKAIPTIILLNTKGEEVFRWLDFQPAAGFAKSLQKELKKTAINKEELQKKAQLGDAVAISSLGFLAYNSMNCAEAIKWFSLSKLEIDQKFKLAAEVNCAQEAADKDEKMNAEYLQTVQKAIILTTSKIDQLRWFVDWIEKLKESGPLNEDVKSKGLKIVEALREIEKNSKVLKTEFLKSTFGETASFEKAESRALQARVFAALENKGEKEKTDLVVVSEMKKKKISVLRPGEMLMVIAYLREAGEKQLVEKLYQQLIAKYSTSYVYFEKYARFLLKEKKAEKALEQVNKAMLYTEGNEPQIFLLKARILIELNQKEMAAETINKALSLKNIEHSKFKKIVSQLVKMKDEFNQPSLKE